MRATITMPRHKRSDLWIAAAVTAFLVVLLSPAQADPLLTGKIETRRQQSANDISRKTKNVTPMHKALLTQRGYIQFLRWELPVPEIEEFTFCVWVKSTNLTYPHSIFSYSKDEKDRLVRAWISAYGQSVHLEINNVEIFSHSTDIQEHRWYHICESWDNGNARYGLWIDGLQKLEGYAPKMAGHVIPSDGDIVLGQEYTDFDKGLEEGIEGAVLGFNLILASAFEPLPGYFERNKLEEADVTGIDTRTTSVLSYGARKHARVMSTHPVFDRIPLTALGSTESSREKVFRIRAVRDATSAEKRSKRKSNLIGNFWGIQDSGTKPLGQQLIDTSFANCEQGRGSPHIGGDRMLISWTRTPVRVFGGAIIKNAKSDCGQF